MEINKELKGVISADDFENVPDHLKGIKIGDRLVITKIREGMPDYAKYLLGMRIIVNEVTRYNMANTDYIMYFIKEVLDDSAPSARERIIKNGYKGDFSEMSIAIYPDMVEFLEKKEKKDDEKKEEKRVVSLCTDSRDPEIIKEMISKVDRERLEKMIRIATQKRDLSSETVDWFLNEWAKNKYEFYLAFGKNLSISSPIEFKMDENEMHGLVTALYMEWPKYAATLDRIASHGMESFLENRMPSDSFFAKYMPDVYVRGSKVSKFLSRICKDEEFDIAISKVMQNRMVKGNVTVSIDPYDYLTSATSMHGWTSCHSLQGGYRAGCFTFVTDPGTLVAFRDNGKMYHYSNVIAERDGNVNGIDFGKNAFVGNSKSWRQYIHVDKKTCACLFSREYPQNKTVDGVIDKVRELIEGAISGYLGIDNVWDNYGDIKKLGKTKYEGSVLYREETTHHYSDILNWDSLLGRYKIRKTLVAPANTDVSKILISVGGQLRCFSCGRELSPNSHYVTCSGC